MLVLLKLGCTLGLLGKISEILRPEAHLQKV